MPAGWCCPRSCLPGRAATVRVRQRCMPARSQVQERPSAAHSHVMPSVPIIATSRKIPSFYTREGSSGGGWRSEDRPRRKDRGLMSLYRCHLLLVRLRGLRACARAARAPGAQGRGAVCMALLRNWAASWAVTPGGRVAGRDSHREQFSHAIIMGTVWRGAPSFLRGSSVAVAVAVAASSPPPSLPPLWAAWILRSTELLAAVMPLV